MVRLLASAALAALAFSCGGRPAARPPVPAAPAPETAGAPAVHVAVVDLIRCLRAHARWPEVLALDHQIEDLQAKLAAAAATRPQVVRIDMPKVDLSPEMKAAVDRMRPEFQQQAEAAKAAARDQLNAYVAQIRADQQKKMDAKRVEVEAGLATAVKEKQQQLEADNNQFQQQTLAQYRLPLLNLKLKADNVQNGKAGSEKLNQQLQALTKERDDKINAHNIANQEALAAFQKAQIQTANEQMQAYQKQLNGEGQQAVNARAAQLTDALRAQLRTTQAAFDQRLREQQSQLVAAARQQEVQAVEKFKAQAQTQAQHQLAAENSQFTRLQQQLRGLQQSRAQLIALITADIRVEAAALAAEKRWDAVLTQTVAAPGAVDATDELIGRLKH